VVDAGGIPHIDAVPEQISTAHDRTRVDLVDSAQWQQFDLVPPPDYLAFAAGRLFVVHERITDLRGTAHIRTLSIDFRIRSRIGVRTRSYIRSDLIPIYSRR
jgi:hypothetical protein